MINQSIRKKEIIVNHNFLKNMIGINISIAANGIISARVVPASEAFVDCVHGWLYPATIKCLWTSLHGCYWNGFENLESACFLRMAIDFDRASRNREPGKHFLRPIKRLAEVCRAMCDWRSR
jgi:hypothetical protein